MYVRNRYLIAHGTYVISLIPWNPVHVDASFAELKTIRAGIVVRGRRPVKTRDVHFLDAVIVIHADCREENVVAVKNSLLKFRAIRFSKLEEGYSRKPFMMTVGAALWSNAPSLYPPGRH